MAKANAPATPTQTDSAGKDTAADTAAELTGAEAAQLVFREVPKLDKDGNPTGRTENIEITAAEVLDFADHGDHVVVVTVDGQKFTGQKQAAK